MANLAKNSVIIKECRVSYVHCFEPSETPSGAMKYSVCILVPEDDNENMKAVDVAIKHAIAKGIADGKITKAMASKFKKGKGNGLPVRFGSEEHAEGERGKEFDGHYFINANSKDQPGVLELTPEGRRVPILNESDLYSGCFCHIVVSFAAYNTSGNRGIGAYINHIMKVGEGDRLDGRTSVDDAFSEYGEATDGEESDAF